MVGRIPVVPGDARRSELRIADNQILRQIRATQQSASNVRKVQRVVQVLRKTTDMIIGKETTSVGIQANKLRACNRRTVHNAKPGLVQSVKDLVE